MIQPQEGLFTSEGDPAPEYWVDDLANLHRFIERFYERYDLKSEVGFLNLFPVEYHSETLLRTHVRIPSPSVFKRVAAFTLGFMQESPLKVEFGPTRFGAKIGHMRNHQNAIIAFGYARRCLVNATYVCREKTVTLVSPIRISVHSYTDLIQFLITVPRQTMASAPTFHGLALLFEQLAYSANDEDCSDPRIV